MAYTFTLPASQTVLWYRNFLINVALGGSQRPTTGQLWPRIRRNG